MNAYDDNLLFADSDQMADENIGERNHSQAGNGARSKSKNASVRNSDRNRDELSRIQEELYEIATAAALLQIAENSLTLAIANLAQMKRLANDALNGISDGEQTDSLISAFNELVEQNQRIAEATTFREHALHRDEQTFVLYADGVDTVIWKTQRLPEIDTELAARPDAVLQSIENAVNAVLAYRNGVRCLLATLLELSDIQCRKSEGVFNTETVIPTPPAAKIIAYRTATELLTSENAALAAHSNGVSVIAGTLFG